MLQTPRLAKTMNSWILRCRERLLLEVHITPTALQRWDGKSEVGISTSIVLQHIAEMRTTEKNVTGQAK